MKFKNEKNVEEGQEARILTLTDKDGDVLTVRAYIDGKPQGIIAINDDGADDGHNVGMTREKAIKLAYTILNELEEYDF